MFMCQIFIAIFSLFPCYSLIRSIWKKNVLVEVNCSTICQIVTSQIIFAYQRENKMEHMLQVTTWGVGRMKHLYYAVDDDL